MTREGTMKTSTEEVRIFCMLQQRPADRLRRLLIVIYHLAHQPIRTA
jgi:hypothetical protein